MPISESRERQRLYIPVRSGMRKAPWRPGGQEPDLTPEIHHRVAARIAVLVLIAALNVLLPSALPLLETVILLVDAVGLIVVFDSLNRLWQGFRHRPPRMRWITFPARVGGRLEAVLTMWPVPDVVGPVLAILRCVRDEQVEEEGGESGLAPVVIYRQVDEFPVPGDRLREVRLAFDIPADLPGTDLDRTDAVYWQIAVRIPVVGPDLETAFLAPVYAQGA